MIVCRTVNPETLKLPTVTLLLYAPVEAPNLAALVLNKCQEKIAFGAVKLLSSSPPDIVGFQGDFVRVPLCSWAAGQQVQAYRLREFFDTEHMLLCETDGFVVNPRLWNPEWLKLDFIGAPWAPNSNPRQANAPDHSRVGNGGFSLQSRRFRETLWENRERYKPGTPSDVWFGQDNDMLNIYQQKGLRLATIHEAIRFSCESEIPEYPDWSTNQSFGFHGRRLHPSLCPI